MGKLICRLSFAFLIFLFMEGCCLKSITLKPELNAVDLKTAKAGSANFEAKLDFKDCCPSKEQEALALKVQSAAQNLYDKLLNNEITLEEYNKKVQAAKDAIENVILVCSAKPVKIMAIGEREQKLKEAWNEVEKVLGVISKP